MQTVRIASQIHTKSVGTKVKPAQPAAKKPGCGSGAGGFKPGNTCGKGGRAKLAADLRAARVTAKNKDELGAVNRAAKSLRDHRRGNAGAITDAKARELRSLVGKPRAEAIATTKAGKPIATGVHRDPSSHSDHEPGYVGNLDTSLLRVDAHRFQYKIGSGEGGVVGSLDGVKKFDPELGGVLAVWKDKKDGQTYVINGHNRLDLAKRAGQKQLAVRYIEAKDAKEARARGALINISEGRGSAIDAGKFFRDSGLTREQIADKGIPLREKIATDGLALSKLDDSVFKRVVNGDLTPERGAIIGGANLDHHEQRALLKLVDKAQGKKKDAITNSHLRELTDIVKSSRSVRKETHDLFGSSAEDESLALHKSKLQSNIKDRLAKEKRLFGVVGKGRNADELAKAGNRINVDESAKISHEAAAALGGFDLLKNLKGDVSKHLNDGAERLHKGENVTTVNAETYKRVLKALREQLA